MVTGRFNYIYLPKMTRLRDVVLSSRKRVSSPLLVFQRTPLVSLEWPILNYTSTRAVCSLSLSLSPSQTWGRGWTRVNLDILTRQWNRLRCTYDLFEWCVWKKLRFFSCWTERVDVASECWGDSYRVNRIRIVRVYFNIRGSNLFFVVRGWCHRVWNF